MAFSTADPVKCGISGEFPMAPSVVVSLALASTLRCLVTAVHFAGFTRWFFSLSILIHYFFLFGGVGLLLDYRKWQARPIFAGLAVLVGLQALANRSTQVLIFLYSATCYTRASVAHLACPISCARLGLCIQRAGSSFGAAAICV